MPFANESDIGRTDQNGGGTPLPDEDMGSFGGVEGTIETEDEIIITYRLKTELRGNISEASDIEDHPRKCAAIERASSNDIGRKKFQPKKVDLLRREVFVDIETYIRWRAGNRLKD